MSAAEDAEALREATREAHAATKDLRQVLKEARAFEQATLAQEQILARITEQVGAGLAAYEKTLREAIEKATASVYKRFDDLYDLLMGKDRQSRRQGRPDIPELLKQLTELGREEAGGGG